VQNSQISVANQQASQLLAKGASPSQVDLALNAELLIKGMRLVPATPSVQTDALKPTAVVGHTLPTHYAALHGTMGENFVRPLLKGINTVTIMENSAATHGVKAVEMEAAQ
jgi:hypothetical protein